jgi:hypothetical protein
VRSNAAANVGHPPFVRCGVRRTNTAKTISVVVENASDDHASRSLVDPRSDQAGNAAASVPAAPNPRSATPSTTVTRSAGTE